MEVQPFGIRADKVLDYRSECYIAKKLSSTEDEWGNLITNYDTPKKFFFNIMSVTSTNRSNANGTSTSLVSEFGEMINRLKVATLSRYVFDNVFHEFDLAYLDGATPENESVNGENANYRIYSVQSMNSIIKVYFVKLVKEEGSTI